MVRKLTYFLVSSIMVLASCSEPPTSPTPQPAAPVFDKALFCTDLAELTNILASQQVGPGSPLAPQLLVLAQTLATQIPGETALFEEFISQISAKTPDTNFANYIDTSQLQQVLSKELSATCEASPLPPPPEAADSTLPVSCTSQGTPVDCAAPHEKESFVVPAPGPCWSALSPQSLNLAQTPEGPAVDDPRVLEASSVAMGDEVRCSVVFFDPQVVQVVK